MKTNSFIKEVKNDKHMTVADLSDNIIMNQTNKIKRSAKPRVLCSKYGRSI